MKRLCYVIPSLGVGGTERQLVELIRGLAKDHEITIICTRQAGALTGDVRRLGAYVRCLDLWGGWDFRMYGKLRRLFRAHRPDILHSFMFGFDNAVNRAARDTGVPVIISSRRQLASWRKPRHLRVQRKANELVDCIVANSSAVAEYAIEQEKANPGLFRVIPNGVRMERFQGASDAAQVRGRYRIPQEAEVIGIVANFAPVKDYPLFMAIAKELLQRRENIHFLMVGSGPMRRQIERQIVRNGWTDYFTRTATLGELRDLYGMMNASVLCSKAEGSPNALIEAMACGVPTVAAAVGGVPKLIEDGVTGRLVTSREPSDFADAIESCLDQHEESQAMTKRATDYVCTHLSCEDMVTAYRSLYTEFLVKSAKNGI